MNTYRHKHGALVFENKLYVIGGVNRISNAKVAIEVYEEDSNQWKIVGETDASQEHTSVCVGNISFPT